MLLAGAAAIASAAASPIFEALRWTAPGTEYEVLASRPATCLHYQADHEQAFQAGQALFNSPTLLGGQATKAGLSCASCHVEGHGNPNFQLAGISDKPGTADVTNSFFSIGRSNGRFDPVPIPDLAVPGKVSRETGGRAMEKFIRNLIVEEFGGEEPSHLTLEALSIYVRALDPCQTNEQRRLQDQWVMIKGALIVAANYSARDKQQEATPLIAAARHQLQLIYERYEGPKFVGERKALLSASQELMRISQMEDAKAQSAAIGKWQQDFTNRLMPQLSRKEDQSLYNPDRLAKLFPPSGKHR